MTVIVYIYSHGSDQRMSRPNAAYAHVILTDCGRADFDGVLLQDPNPVQK